MSEILTSGSHIKTVASDIMDQQDEPLRSTKKCNGITRKFSNAIDGAFYR